ncbi:3'-5' exonuclease [Caminicella sporogenes]|uniref:3'-5' exonuclease n=1 Tax=Caminicella sporogenes TaxID=166485 RepID=UPI002540DE28|nr:3'-5' exonuclease [Caminicella sporogenes]WIF95103.1 3'-5' exonuclease [Caminicella sporogenes]
MWVILIIVFFAIAIFINKNHIKTNKNQKIQKSIHKAIKVNELNFSKQIFNEFVALDLETTGLNPAKDKIVEIAAIKYKDNQEIDRMHSLINPCIDIPNKITKINGINNDMVKNSPKIEEILPDFINFIGDLPIVVHNARFDINFLNANMFNFNMNVTNPIIDTLQISREIFKNLPNYKLETIKDYLKINLSSHRALDDAKVAAEIYLRYCKIKTEYYKKLNDSFSEEELKCYELVKNILIKNNRDIKYLRYSRTGKYFDVNALYNIFRIKLNGKKKYIISKKSIEQLKLINPEFKYESCPKSETGKTRIIINNYNDLVKFENLILESFDEAIKEIEYYISNVKCGKKNVDEYLSSLLK